MIKKYITTVDSIGSFVWWSLKVAFIITSEKFYHMFNSNIKLKVIKYNNNNIYEQFVSSYHLILKYANVPYISGIEKY